MRSWYIKVGTGEVHLWRIPFLSGLQPELGMTAEEELLSASYPRLHEVSQASLMCDMTQENYRYYCGARHAILACYTALPMVHRTASGKPYLVRNTEEGPIAFSTSHTVGAACIAVTGRQSVGVDIELLDPSPDYSSVARLYLSPVEQDWLYSHSPECFALAFLRIWTLKEAYRKYLGVSERGLAWPSFSIVPFAPASGEVRWGCTSPYQQASPVTLLEGAFGPGYIVGLAVTDMQNSEHEPTVVLQEYGNKNT